jgi:hypothetical protein
MSDPNLSYIVKRGQKPPTGKLVSFYVHQVDRAGFAVIICNTTSEHYAEMIADALNAQTELKASTPIK